MGRDADGQRERLGRACRVAAIEGAGENPASHRETRVDVRARQHDRELVATHAEGAIVAPEREQDRPPDVDQQLVAGGMASLVVDALQVVDIDEQERQ